VYDGQYAYLQTGHTNMACSISTVEFQAPDGTDREETLRWIVQMSYYRLELRCTACTLASTSRMILAVAKFW